MVDPDTEQEKYSIDEMMERLRSRSSAPRDGEAELVTREDGSQVYRVRKRKRRSHQPKKEEEKRRQRFKVAQVVGGVALVGGVVLVALGGLVYLNTPIFRKHLIEKVQNASGATTTISGLRVTPISVSAGSVDLRWPEGSVLTHLAANGVSGDLKPVSLFGKWEGHELVASNDSVLELAVPSAPLAARTASTQELPFQFSYRGKRVSVIGGDAASPGFKVNQSELVLTVLNRQGSVGNLLLQGGTLMLPGWDPLNLEFASIQFIPEGMRLGTMRFNPPGSSKAVILVDNKDNLTTTLDGKPIVYHMEMTRVPMTALVGTGLGKIFTAEVNGVKDEAEEEATFTLTLPSDHPVSFRAPFRSHPTIAPTLSGLAFLNRLKEDLRFPAYGRPAFDIQADGVVSRNEKGVRLERLELRTRGYITIRGDIGVDPAGQLSGVLEVGVPEANIQEAGGGYPRTFQRVDGGMAWAVIKLSGTVAAPEDDLLTQLQRGGSAKAGDSGAGRGSIGSEVPKDKDKEWEELTR